jgi:acyl-homoserine lactone acylase PvdQ
MRFTRFAFVFVLAVLAPPTAALAATAQPYGTNDAGGFRNVLPSGEAGGDNVLQLAQFKATGARPDHWSDQEPLYDGLLYASPSITAADVDKYFKDATFGVRPDDVGATETPRPGVTIVRDKTYGVPHIYGDTPEDVEFGAGYAGAEDRLFLMDVLRHTARAQLSSFAGGSAGNRAMDRTQWLIAPYTEADLQKQIDDAGKLYGALGEHIKTYGQAFVDGINAYISEAQLDPTKMPAEYAAFGTTPQPWKLTDVIAEASLIGGIFGKGGGNELRSALALEALENRFGKKRGARAWADFRSKNDPEAPTTILKKRFPYETASAFSKRGLALPDPGSVKFVDVGPPLPGSSSSALATSRFGQIPDDGSIGSTLMRAASSPHASNWELVPARNSASGHPIGVLGPQVGYYDPQILMEEDLHGPGFDARGVAFPGVNLMVQLGHGRDYAWSATTANSDNVDTFAEVLCQDDYHYLYKGQCRPMDKLEVTNSWQPSVGDQDGPGSETLTAYRTVHGIVYARGTVHGKPVAFVSARTTYMHEADSSVGFFCLNDPSCTHDYQSFRQAVGGISFAFNWGYIDSKHIGYQLSGAYPQRAKGTSPDFPILGTGQYDWQGFNPDLYTMKTVPLNARPHAEDQRYLVSWNNKQAPGWAAADDRYSYGPVFRQQMIVDFVRRGLAGGKKMRLQQLVQAMEESATQDIRALYVLPIVERALGKVTQPELRAALDKLDAWRRAGAHRRDLNKDGVYDDNDAVVLMDAWWPKLVDAEFHPALGDDALAALRTMLPYGEERGTDPYAPDFESGWYGQVSKDLRDLFTPKRVRGRYSRVYCGDGSKRRCRAALLQSLSDALKVTPAELYGHGDCASDPTPYCFDKNRFTTASAITNDPMLFQNRPTFQQAVEIPRSLPR